MVAQTQYEKNTANAHAGMLSDMGNTDIDSFAAEATAIPYGTFVARGTDKERQCVLGTALAIGVAIRVAREAEFPSVAFDGGGEYLVEDTVGVLREGYIWARFDAAGGTVGAVVTINASGQVVAAGGGTALTVIKATIEVPAVDATIETTTTFVGMVKVFAA